MTENNRKNNAARSLGAAVAGAALLALFQAPSVVSAASGPERSLAGIHIFDPGSEVTAKFGNPSRILVGGIAPGAFTPGSATAVTPGGSSAGGYPGSQGSPGQSSPGQSAGVGLLPGFPGVPTGGQGGFPGAGGEFPGAPGAAGTPTAAVVPPKQPVTLIYDRQNGGSLEFTISPDKRVIQIRETGYSGSYGTARGIKLGMKYSDVNRLYGYPENTLIQGPIINTDYKDSLHCGFQFLDQRLVGIIIASPD